MACLKELPLNAGVTGSTPGARPQGRGRTRWRDHISHPALENLGVLPEELAGGSGGRDGSGFSQTDAFGRFSGCWMDAVA